MEPIQGRLAQLADVSERTALLAMVTAANTPVRAVAFTISILLFNTQDRPTKT